MFHILRHADASVGDANAHPRTLRQPLRDRAIAGNARRANRERSARLHGVPCVHRKIQKHLFNLRGVGANAASIVTEFGNQLDVFAN